jgi:hypothetical protein
MSTPEAANPGPAGRHWGRHSTPSIDSTRRNAIATSAGSAPSAAWRDYVTPAVKRRECYDEAHVLLSYSFFDSQTTILGRLIHAGEARRKPKHS